MYCIWFGVSFRVNIVSVVTMVVVKVEVVGLMIVLGLIVVVSVGPMGLTIVLGVMFVD